MLLEIVGVPVELNLELDDEAESLVRSNFGAFRPLSRGRPKVRISAENRGEGYRITWVSGHDEAVDSGRDELIHSIESYLVMGLQFARPELVFLHSAALEFEGRAFLISGASGNGKSTLAWALTHHGCAYLSDELAPIDLTDPKRPIVNAYPHSLNQKRCPAEPYALPEGTPFTGWTYHIPVNRLPSGVCYEPRKVFAVFLVEQTRGEPVATPLSAAEGAFRLYPNLLNGLAHEAAGLKAARSLSQNQGVYLLESADLTATAKLVLETLNQ
ncbi:MAG: hypothetical protein AAF358_17505 [Pseudomonadota bacterium]